MACNDFITRRLNEQYETCLNRLRRRRTSAHWRHYPPLDGRSIEEVAGIVGNAHHADHNAVAGALLAAHRDRSDCDGDTEIVLLLVAARPLVLVLDPADRHGDSRASLWTAVARRLAALDPAQVAASPIPFLVALLGRIRPDAAKHPSEPRSGLVVTNVALDRLLERRCDPDQDVPAAAIARVYLGAARQHRGYHELVHYAMYGRGDGLVHPSRVARHRRRVANAIGYVA